MTLYSQSAILNASEKFRSLHNALHFEVFHNAIMDNEFEIDPDIRPANLLRAWRDKREMTMDELGKKVGTTQAVIWHLENAQRKLSPKWLYRLGPALGIPPGYLLDCHPDDVNNEAIELFNQLPPEKRSLALDLIRALLIASN